MTALRKKRYTVCRRLAHPGGWTHRERDAAVLLSTSFGEVGSDKIWHSDNPEYVVFDKEVSQEHVAAAVGHAYFTYDVYDEGDGRIPFEPDKDV